MSLYEIPVPASLKMSANDRLHWRPKSDRIRALRLLAKFEARNRGIAPQQERIDVGLIWHTPDRRRRDPDNLVVPMFKALCDGVVDAGVVPDDTSLFMRRTMPEIVLAADRRERFTFWIRTFDQYGEDAA